MSYQVYDENGYVGDFATTKGMGDFLNWCKATGDGELIDFANNGMYIFPAALMESLAEFTPPIGEVRKTYDDFMSLLPKCKGIVFISDGINDALEELEEV